MDLKGIAAVALDEWISENGNNGSRSEAPQSVDAVAEDLNFKSTMSKVGRGISGAFKDALSGARKDGIGNGGASASGMMTDLVAHDRRFHKGNYRADEGTCKFRERLAKTANELGTGGVGMEELRNKIGGEAWKAGAREADAEAKGGVANAELNEIRELNDAKNKERDPEKKAELQAKLDALRDSYYKRNMRDAEYSAMKEMKERAKQNPGTAKNVIEAASKIAESESASDVEKDAAKSLVEGAVSSMEEAYRNGACSAEDLAEARKDAAAAMEVPKAEEMTASPEVEKMNQEDLEAAQRANEEEKVREDSRRQAEAEEKQRQINEAIKSATSQDGMKRRAELSLNKAVEAANAQFEQDHDEAAKHDAINKAVNKYRNSIAKLDGVAPKDVKLPHEVEESKADAPKEDGESNAEKEATEEPPKAEEPEMTPVTSEEIEKADKTLAEQAEKLSSKAPNKFADAEKKLNEMGDGVITPKGADKSVSIQKVGFAYFAVDEDGNRVGNPMNAREALAYLNEKMRESLKKPSAAEGGASTATPSGAATEGGSAPSGATASENPSSEEPKGGDVPYGGPPKPNGGKTVAGRKEPKQKANGGIPPVNAQPKEFTVNGKTYVDLSKEGFFSGIAKAFKAGWQGKDIITAWDKVTGRWDKIVPQTPAQEKGLDSLKGGMEELVGKMLERDDVSGPQKAYISDLFNAWKDAKSGQKPKFTKALMDFMAKNGIGETSGVKQDKPTGIKDDLSSVADHSSGGVVTGSIASSGYALDTSALDRSSKISKGSLAKKDDAINKIVNDFTKVVGAPINKSDISVKDGISSTEMTINMNGNGSKASALIDAIETGMGNVVGLKDSKGDDKPKVTVSYDKNTDRITVSFPNDVKGSASFANIIDHPEWSSFKAKNKGKGSFFVGIDSDTGRPIASTLDDMVHLLTVGTTGSGKSVKQNTILASLLDANSPDDVRLILCDPKQVEFTNFKGDPHLIGDVVTDRDTAIQRMNWLADEMENRYKLLEKAGVRDLGEYNAKGARGELPEGMPKHLPRIAMAVDEFADWNGKDLDAAVKRLGAKARASGIHLLLSTQRANVDSISGTIQANMPSRLALTLMTGADASRFGTPGAENLPKKGPFLFKTDSGTVRGEGAYTGTKEIGVMVDAAKKGSVASQPNKLNPSPTSPTPPETPTNNPQTTPPANPTQPTNPTNPTSPTNSGSSQVQAGASGTAGSSSGKTPKYWVDPDKVNSAGEWVQYLGSTIRANGKNLSHQEAIDAFKESCAHLKEMMRPNVSAEDMAEFEKQVNAGLKELQDDTSSTPWKAAGSQASETSTETQNGATGSSASKISSSEGSSSGQAKAVSTKPSPNMDAERKQRVDAWRKRQQENPLTLLKGLAKNATDEEVDAFIEAASRSDREEMAKILRKFDLSGNRKQS